MNEFEFYSLFFHIIKANSYDGGKFKNFPPMLMYNLHFTNRISRLLDSEIKEFEREVNILQITAVVGFEKYK